ncbi:hypothetical protein ACOZ38_25025 [Sphaerisporangium viridialbum]|uniref:hypothetical protein n=1 Tax=Sphaerisporangium viridialbum TaxID=46189 RepID=UPI003C725B98
MTGFQKLLAGRRERMFLDRVVRVDRVHVIIRDRKYDHVIHADGPGFSEEKQSVPAIIKMIKGLAETDSVVVSASDLLLMKHEGKVWARELRAVERMFLKRHPGLSDSPAALLSAFQARGWNFNRLHPFAEAVAEPPRGARRVASWAATVAVEPERDEEWREALNELAVTGSRRDVVHFAVGILYAGLHSRATWMARQATKPGMAALCWVLRSQARTWMLISALLLWAGVETAEDTGVGAAIVVVLTGATGLQFLTEVLRKHFSIRLPRETEPLE